MWGIYISSNGLPMCWSIRVFLSLAVVCPVVGVSICVFRYVCLQERSVHVLGGECLADCAQLWTRGWGCASSAADTPFPGACLLIDPSLTPSLSSVCVGFTPTHILWTPIDPSFPGTELDPPNTADTTCSSLGPYPHSACPAQLGPETHAKW